MNTIRNLQAQLDRLTDRIAELARFGSEPEPGTVIAVTVRYDSIPGIEYEYILFRADNGEWYTTARVSQPQVESWDDIINWLADPRMTIVSASVVSGWAPLDWSDIEEDDDE